MACFKPMKARYIEGTYSLQGNQGMKLLGYFNADVDLESLHKKDIFLIPCGKCLGCKLDYARHWADRLILEYEFNPHAIFVTLTYNNEHLPVTEPDVNGEVFSTLVKKHVSRFIKNLRSRKEFKDIKIRFFCSGEYGEKFHRCHYHLIIFGIDLELLAKVSRLIYKGKNELNQIYWECPLLDSIWTSPTLIKRDGEWHYEYEPLGFVQVSETSYDTMSYVARYSVKKALGNSWIDDKPVATEFSLMSRNPGIGFPFLEKHEGIIDDVEVFYHQGKKIYWPRYLVDKYYGHKVRIEVFQPEPKEVFGIWYNGKFVERKNRKNDLMIENFMKKYGYEDRWFDEVVDTDLTYKEKSIKMIPRGDAVMC